MQRIRVSGPWITPKEVGYVTDAVTNAWYGNANVYHDRFEKAFADYLGVRHAMALPSCTSAIHLALLALGVGPGDEVIVPDCTWIASAAPINYVGATPVFADIDPQSWCLSAASLEACVTPRTKAIIPVDLYGNLPDMDALLAVAAPGATCPSSRTPPKPSAPNSRAGGPGASARPGSSAFTAPRPSPPAKAGCW